MDPISATGNRTTCNTTCDIFFHLLAVLLFLRLLALVDLWRAATKDPFSTVETYKSTVCSVVEVPGPHCVSDRSYHVLSVP